MNVLIESPKGEQMTASEKAFNVIYKPLYNYKLIDYVEEEVEEVIKDSKPKSNKGSRRPKFGGE